MVNMFYVDVINSKLELVYLQEKKPYKLLVVGQLYQSLIYLEFNTAADEKVNEDYVDFLYPALVFFRVKQQL